MSATRRTLRVDEEHLIHHCRVAGPSTVSLERCACGIALEGRLGQAYNEEAFRYFLAIERWRSQRSGRSFLLLLVHLKEQSSAHIGPLLARKLFSGLWLCLRETDVVGWFRQERVVGAVLAELQNGPGTEVSHRIRQRVSGVLCQRLSSDAARQLRVRVCQPLRARAERCGSPPNAGAQLISGEI